MRVLHVEFAALMAPLGPFVPGRRVIAAVSGGPDSLCLAWLLRQWGAPRAIIVDHALRPDSAEEAARTLERLHAMQVPARIVRIQVPPGPALGARARAARYDALLAGCREEGLPDLVLGHHVRDQAETQILRARRGSGPAGLAGMAAVSWRGDARLLRPLLGIDPARLRITLRAAGFGWAEDPGNTDPATARGALRQAPQPPPDAAAGPARQAAEAALADELARNVELHPAGYARMHGPISAAAWSALAWTLSGRPHPPSARGAERLARSGQGTLHGVLVRGGYAMREASGPDVPAAAGAVWDGRFVLDGTLPGAVVGALADDARRFRGRSGLPVRVLRRFLCLRQDGKLSAVPHLDFAAGEYCPSVHSAFRPMRPLAGAAFVPAAAGLGDAHGAATHHVVACGGQASGTGWGPLGSNDEQFRT